MVLKLIFFLLPFVFGSCLGRYMLLDQTASPYQMAFVTVFFATVYSAPGLLMGRGNSPAMLGFLGAGITFAASTMLVLGAAYAVAAVFVGLFIFSFGALCMLIALSDAALEQQFG